MNPEPVSAIIGVFNTSASSSCTDRKRTGSMTTSPTKNSSSKRMFIIILAIGGVLILSGVLIIGVIAVGIFLFKSGPPERDYDPPRPTNQRPISSNGGGNNSVKSFNKTDALVLRMEEISNVGGFKLENVIRSDSDRTYRHSWAEVKGLYAANGQKVSHLVAQYDSSARATLEFGRMVGRARSDGATVTAPIKVSGKMINAEFVTKATRHVAFCDWNDKEAVLCNLIESNDADAIDKFRAGLTPR